MASGARHRRLLQLRLWRLIDGARGTASASAAATRALATAAVQLHAVRDAADQISAEVGAEVGAAAGGGGGCVLHLDPATVEQLLAVEIVSCALGEAEQATAPRTPTA